MSLTRPTNPRDYLIPGEDIETVQLGEVYLEKMQPDCFAQDEDVLKKLRPDQRSDYRDARRDGLRPVLLLDLLSGVTFLEMRRVIPPPRQKRDGQNFSPNTQTKGKHED